MDTEANKERVEAIFAALAEGDGSPFVAAMSDDFAWTITGTATSWAGTWQGKREVREQLFGHLFEHFSPADTYTNRAVSITAEEDRVVVECRGSVATKDGGRYDNQYCYVCRFDDGGELASLVEYSDTALIESVLSPPPPR
jgi:uncharacterized protein